MTSDNIKNLIYDYRTEKSWIDFKRDFYDFGNIEKKKDCLKDILSMINTKREESSYIIFGVEQMDGQNTLYGIPNDYADDNVITSFIRDQFNYLPEIEWHFEKIDGKNIGIIEFPLQPLPFPIHLKRNKWGISHKDIFIRKGSSNKIADDQEISYLHDWLREIEKQIGLRKSKPKAKSTKVIIVNQSEIISDSGIKKGVIKFNKKYTNSILSLRSEKKYFLIDHNNEVSLSQLGDILIQQEHQLISDPQTILIFIFDNKISGNFFFGFNSYSGYISTNNWQYIEQETECSINTYILNSVIFILLNRLLGDTSKIQHKEFTGCVFDYCKKIKDKASVLDASFICDEHKNEIEGVVTNRGSEILNNINDFLDEIKEI